MKDAPHPLVTKRCSWILAMLNHPESESYLPAFAAGMRVLSTSHLLSKANLIRMHRDLHWFNNEQLRGHWELVSDVQLTQEQWDELMRIKPTVSTPEQQVEALSEILLRMMDEQTNVTQKDENCSSRVLLT